MKRNRFWIGLAAGAALFAAVIGCGAGGEAASGGQAEASGQAAETRRGFPAHEPYGTGRGAMPGRVVWTHDPDAVRWDGEGWWWELSHFDRDAVLAMTRAGIASLGGKDNARGGWEALFRAHNRERGREGAYAPGEKIAIKVNMNGSAEFDDDTSGRTGHSYTNPVVLKALLTSLVEDAGVRPEDITVYDVTRLFPAYMVSLCQEGTTRGVRFVSRANGEADPAAPLRWSAMESPADNFLPTCVTEAAYLINLANLKGHDYGVTLCAKNHFGSFINDWRIRAPQQAGLHSNVSGQTMGSYSVLTDLMGHASLGGKTVLYMFDALLAPPGNTVDIRADNTRWQQPPFGGGYTASLFFSQDPVAIDSVGADFLMNEPTVLAHNGVLRGNRHVENYLHEAALADDPPSGTVYRDGEGRPMKSLGVHEHWNNGQDKQYSRNRGEAEGIELVYLPAF